jgi:N-acetylglucosamine malate deacetylase 1
MKILVVGAHPDDEILGVGGTICRHIVNGDQVSVCIVTKAIEPRWSKQYMEQKRIEQQAVDRLLGVSMRYHLDFPTTQLNTISQGELNDAVNQTVDVIRPDIVYTHFGDDLNADHGLVSRACLVATRPPKRIKLLCFETLSETEWGTTAFKPNMWINIGEYIEKKIQAFNIYVSEVQKYPHPRSADGIKSLARNRGTEACLEYAEGFVLIREIQ